GAPHQSQLDSRLRQYQALVEAAESIASHRDLSSLLHDLRDRLGRVVKSSAVHLILHDAEHNLMRRHVLDEAFPPRQIPSAGLAIEDAPAGWVWETQQPLLIEDVSSIRTRYPSVAAELEEYGIKTIYILPLSSLGRRLGALAFISSHENAWGEEDQEILQ